MRNVVVGLFDDQACVGQAIEWLSIQSLGQNLMIITSDRVIRKPPSVDPNQLSTNAKGVRKSDASKAGGEQALWGRSGWGSYIPTKTLEKIGQEGIREILVSRGIREGEAYFYAEGVRHGGILLLVEVDQGSISDVQQLFKSANAKKVRGA